MKERFNLTFSLKISAQYCHYYIKQSSGQISLPVNQQQGNYASSLTCTWAIETPLGTNVFINVSFKKLHAHLHCIRETPKRVLLQTVKTQMKCSIIFLFATVTWLCYFVRISMKFSPKCRAHFWIGKGAYIPLQIMPWKPMNSKILQQKDEYA